MLFISMDLISEFHLKASAGNSYALTSMCMLTGYTVGIQIKLKPASDAISAYIDHVYAKFNIAFRNSIR